MCPHMIEKTDSPVYRGRMNVFVNKHNNSPALCLFVCIGRLCLCVFVLVDSCVCVCVLVDHERSHVYSLYRMNVCVCW